MMKRKAVVLSETERADIIRWSYGNSASVIAHQLGITKAVVLRIIREVRGKHLPWGAREKDVSK